jgi:hypothetical protein
MFVPAAQFESPRQHADSMSAIGLEGRSAMAGRRSEPPLTYLLTYMHAYIHTAFELSK